MNAFKKNPALFIGLALPLVMILVFTAVPFIASFTVSPPKYNFIYSFNTYGQNVNLKIIDEKLVVEIHNTWREPREIQQTFYLIDVHSNKSTKLNFLPSTGNALLIPPGESRDFILEGLSLGALDTSTLSPDGYQIITENNDSFFSLLFFFGSNRRNFISLKKSGRTENFSLPNPNYGGKFEGWVIPKALKEKIKEEK